MLLVEGYVGLVLVVPREDGVVGGGAGAVATVCGNEEEEEDDDDEWKEDGKCEDVRDEESVWGDVKEGDEVGRRRY